MKFILVFLGNLVLLMLLCGTWISPANLTINGFGRSFGVLTLPAFSLHIGIPHLEKPMLPHSCIQLIC